MKKVTLLFFLVVSHFSFAQLRGQARVDSLLTELKKAKPDTNQVNLLMRISGAYFQIDQQQSFNYGKKAVDLAKQIKSKEAASTAAYILGNKYAAFGNNKEAINWYKEALPYQIEKGDTEGISTVYNNISASYQNLSDFPKSLEYAFDALRLFEKNGNLYGQANCLTNIGGIYNYQNDHENVLKYSNQAAQIYKENNWISEYAKVIGNIGIEYHLMGDSKKGLVNLEKAYHIYDSLNELEGKERLLENLGEVYLKTGDYKTALEKFEQCTAITRIPEFSMYLGYGLAGLAATYLDFSSKVPADQLPQGLTKAKALQLALSYGDSSVVLLEQIGDVNALSSAVEVLSKAQALSGNYSGAYKNQARFKELNDSIFNMERDKKLTQTAMQYDFDKKEAAAKAEQEKKDLRQRTIRNTITGGLAGTFIFLVVVYRQRNRIAKEKERSEELLLNILPAETAEELKQTGSAKAKDFSEVTVMFTDFKNFTAMSEKLSAQELVNEINYCYSAFDNIITKHGVEKIKTIGDSYMCAGGLPVASKTNADEAILAALEIRDFMIEERKKREAMGKPFFEIRIGCHTGPVVAGIVGIKKFAYDIWGDTVNIASRMESSGEPGKVNVSESTYERIKDNFNCTYRGKIEAKNKGMIGMYFVEGRKA